MHWKTESSAFFLKVKDVPLPSVDSNNIHGADTATNIIDQTTTTVTANSEALQMVRFTVGGKPRPLVRHRSSRGFIYNPSAEGQESFRKVVQELLFPKVMAEDSASSEPHDDDEHGNHTIGNAPQPLFGVSESLIMTMVFRLRRPNDHFVGGRRGPGRLRPTALAQLLPSPRPPDVDNLAKFVLDSLNGLLYTDDRQVVSLHVTKLLDNEGLCLGSTEVCLQRVKASNEQLDRLLTNSFDLLSQTKT
jgi:hypothetical protein